MSERPRRRTARSAARRALAWLAAAAAGAYAPWAAAVVPVAIPASFSTCASCHLAPPGSGGGERMGSLDGSRLDSVTTLRNHIRNFQVTNPASAYNGTVPMTPYANNDALDWSGIHAYLLRVRDGIVLVDGSASPISSAATTNYAFTTAVNAGVASAQTLTLRVANARGAGIASVVLSGLGPHFTEHSNSCSGANPVAAAAAPGTSAPECQIQVKLLPGPGTTAGQPLNAALQVRLNFAAGQAPSQVTYAVQLAGTSAGPVVVPAPEYTASGFAALANFALDAGTSQTICPTVRNTGNLPLQLGPIAILPGGSAGNYAFTSVANCPGAGLPPACPTAPATALNAGAECSVPVQFTAPADTAGSFAATLQVAHDAPPGSNLAYELRANVVNVPTPRIGFFSDPAIANGRVRPPVFTGVLVDATSAEWNQLLVVNDGSADGLDITEVTHSNGAQFSLTETCVAAAPLARLAGQGPSCSVALRYTPRGVGQHCTTVSVRAALSSNGIQRVEVCGTAVDVPVSASLELSRTAIDFGRRQINASYPPQVLELRNPASAGAPLSILVLGLSGPGFVLADNACANAVLAPGASCAVAIQFEPDPTRPETPYSATLAITSNDAQQATRSVALSAVAGDLAPPPVLELPGAGSALMFEGFVLAGRVSEQPLRITLRNAGPGTATGQSLRLVGPDASSFRASGCAATLAAGASCTIEVSFVPGSGGLKSAQLEIVSASSVAPAPVSITGRAVGGSSPFLASSADALAFPSVRVGSNSEPLMLRLAAGGDGALTVSGLQAQGPFAVDMLSCPAAPFVLQAGGECTVGVRFMPDAEGAAQGALLIDTDADPQPRHIALRGTAAAKADTSGGGCSLATGRTLFDPLLAALAALALMALAYRRRARRSAAQKAPP